MVRDLINREKLRRALLYFAYVFVVCFLQDSVFGPISLFGANMMFVPAAAIAIGGFEGGVWGAAFGLILGFFADISFGNVALFTALFPVLGFAAGILTRWYVNDSLFAYLITCFVSFLITAAAQIAGPALAGNPLAPMLWTGLVQSVWSLPMAAAVYYPCRAIGRKKI